MKSEFVTAIAQLSAEKNLDSGTVFEAVEAAMASAFKKDELQYAEIEVKIDVESGDIEAWRVWDVMPDEEIEDDEIQVSPERAGEMGHSGAAEGDRIREPLEASLDAGRIAAQTAKQVVLQRLREAEREAVFDEFTTKQGELVSGTVLRVEAGRRNIILDLGRTEAVLPSAEQVRPEHYRVGQRLRVYVKEVYRAAKGPQVVASRSHPELLTRLLELESPEIAKGTVEIVMMAREPGYRSKVAVISRQDGIDPIGAVVGVRGARIQNVVNELGGERIDVIRWDPNEAGFVANALSPAEVVSVRIDGETNTAFLAVPDKQFSLAIGKEGQNARLTARLTGRRIEISPESVLIRNGDDLYPPPEPNMDALPLAPTPTLPTLPALPDVVAPSQAGLRAARAARRARADRGACRARSAHARAGGARRVRRACCRRRGPGCGRGRRRGGCDGRGGVRSRAGRASIRARRAALRRGDRGAARHRRRAGPAGARPGPRPRTPPPSRGGRAGARAPAARWPPSLRDRRGRYRGGAQRAARRHPVRRRRRRR